MRFHTLIKWTWFPRFITAQYGNPNHFKSECSLCSSSGKTQTLTSDQNLYYQYIKYHKPTVTVNKLTKYCTKYASRHWTYRFRVEYQRSRVCATTYTAIALNMTTKLSSTSVFFCVWPITFTLWKQKDNIQPLH
jgi:hypothetical protein